MNNVKNRKKVILEMLNTSEKLLIVDLLNIFRVSEMTLRRDISSLEKQGVVKKIKGGIIRNSQSSFEIPFDIRCESSEVEKRKIAEKAIQFIKDGQVLVIDNGTTALAVAERITEFQNLTVITSSLRVAWFLSDYPNIKLNLIGGLLKNGEKSTYGSQVLDSYKQLNPDIFIMGASAIDFERGISDFDIEDAFIKASIINRSKKVIVVCDSTKFEKSALAKICDVDEVDYIITSTLNNSALLKKLKLKTNIIL